MTCGVCLEYKNDLIYIFNEEGMRLKIPSIIQQHFWFEPHEDDPTLSRICSSCWEQIANFHIFYTTIREAHSRLRKMCRKSQPFQNEEQVYTIEDSDDDAFKDDFDTHKGTTENHESRPGVRPDNWEESSKYNYYENEDGMNCSEEQFVGSDGSAESVHRFLQQEHEALLDEYTYVEASTKKYLDSQRDIHGVSHFKHYSSDATNAVLTRYSQNHHDEGDKTKEDSLIASYINLQCEVCFVSLETFNALNSHYQAAHNICGYVRCCDKKLPTRSYILDHINQHINPDNYRCKECNKSFSTQYAIKNHLAMKHAPESLKVFKCFDCPQRFTNDYSLNKHLLEHKNEEEKRLYCTDCRQMFPSTEVLNKHRTVHHKRINGHICHVCGIFLKGKKAFGKHIREHATTLGSAVINDPVCPICGKLSASIKTLRHHIRYVHSRERPHKCPICGKQFKIRQKLKEHMSTHEVGVSLPCPYCPKRFRSKIHVYSHKYRMHKREYDMERNSRLEAAGHGTYDRFELETA